MGEITFGIFVSVEFTVVGTDLTFEAVRFFAVRKREGKRWEI